MKLNLLHFVFLVFLVLKLVAIGPVSTWSWWLVCSPVIVLAVWGALEGLIEGIKKS